jgi:hypothetical protein
LLSGYLEFVACEDDIREHRQTCRIFDTAYTEMKVDYLPEKAGINLPDGYGSTD